MTVIRRLNRYELISFVTGFSLLTYELAAARVLAPSIGSSMYVWTSVIGVIIASLALGFFAGGKLADKRDHATDVVWLLLVAGLLCVATLLLYPSVLEAATANFRDVRLQGVFAAVILFAPTSFAIGMTSPYLAKLNVRSLKTTGQHIASLDALNSLGGIIGTFLAGFVLFGFVGSRQTFALVAVLLLAASWLIAPRYRVGERLLFSVAALVIMGLSLATGATNPRVVDIDTPSAHYQVRDYYYKNQPIKALVTDPMGLQSAVFATGSHQPVFWYNRELARLTLEEQPQRVLVLGGGAFTLPQYLAEQLPETQIDVVEIDPGLKKISEDYFRYQNPRNVRLLFNDARAFLNRTAGEYDVIVVDVYGSSTIPFQFMTREYAAALEQNLAPGGVVVANFIAGMSGPCREVFAALDAAYRSQFAHAYYANESGTDEPRANHIVRYSRTAPAPSGLKKLTLGNTASYSDNYAPAERLYYACEQA